MLQGPGACALAAAHLQHGDHLPLVARALLAPLARALGARAPRARLRRELLRTAAAALAARHGSFCASRKK